jgi:hypothetical protein
MTVATDLDAIVGTGFGTTPKAEAVTLAKKYFEVTDGDGDQQELATAMLSAAILLNRRQIGKGRTDNTIAPMNLDELITSEMERLLNWDKKSTTFNIIKHNKPNTSKHWSEG